MSPAGALRERIFAAFQHVGTGKLGLAPEVADEFASHIANANEGIHVAGQLCVGANALQSPTLHLMLERWLRLLPEYEMPRGVLERTPGKPAAAAALGSAASLLCHARVFEVCISQRGLPESQSLQVATHISNAAGAFFALEQACRAPEKHSQTRLCGLLRMCMGAPLANAVVAAEVYLAEREP